MHLMTKRRKRRDEARTQTPPDSSVSPSNVLCAGSRAVDSWHPGRSRYHKSRMRSCSSRDESGRDDEASGRQRCEVFTLLAPSLAVKVSVTVISAPEPPHLLVMPTSYPQRLRKSRLVWQLQAEPEPAGQASSQTLPALWPIGNRLCDAKFRQSLLSLESSTGPLVATLSSGELSGEGKTSEHVEYGSPQISKGYDELAVSI